MINYQTILSNYNKRGTLLKWLRTLQTALEEGALETVTTTTTEDTVVFHFGFADGTSVDSPPIQLEAGPQGPEGPEGPEGPQGPAATIAVGNVTTLPAGSSATVTNTGTSGAAVFDFGLPEGDTGAQGETGPQGPAATIAVGTVSTLSPGSSATVTNSGTSSAAVFDFGIPQGATGSPGEIIDQIVSVEATTTASRAYTRGSYFVNNLGILVEATANIALGATIDSTNTIAVNQTLADELGITKANKSFFSASNVSFSALCAEQGLIGYFGTALDNLAADIANQTSGVVQLASGGPYFHVILFKYSNSYWSGYIGTYNMGSAEGYAPCYFVYANGSCKLARLITI